jgi:hypothetical protein
MNRKSVSQHSTLSLVALGALVLGGCLVVCGGRLQAQTGFVLDTGRELSLTADFNGDGIEDAALVDQESGGVFVAIGLADGSLQWGAQQSAGMSPVLSVAAGRWAQLGRDSLGLGGPLANRIHWVAAPADPVWDEMRTIDVSWEAAHAVAAMDVGGPGNTAFDDFLILSRPGPGLNSAWTAVRNPAGAPTLPVFNQPFPGSLGQLNRIAITPDNKRYLAAVFAFGSQTELRAWDLSGGAAAMVTRLTNLPPATRYITGPFGPANEVMAIGYGLGSMVMRAGRLDLPVPEVRTVILPATLTASVGSIVALRTIPGPGRPDILAFGTLPGTALVLRFNGVDTMSIAQTLQIPEGDLITGMLTRSDGGFQLFTGTEGRSSRFHRYRRSGSQYQLVGSGAMPKLNQAMLGGNVFQFDREPFVNPNPGLLRTHRVPDWTSQFGLGGMPVEVQVLRERFGTSAQGLDNPAVFQVGPAHPDADFGLVNQYHEALSLFTFSQTLGDAVSDVTIHPPPGTFRSGVQVRFTTGQPGHQVYYRLSQAAPWQLYSGAPLHLFSATTIHYYAKPALGNAKSAIQEASYEFLIPEGRVDSDADGVPDFVEQHLNLDPAAGGDSDQDTFSDLEEIIAGTNPANAGSKPAERPASQSDAGMRFRLTPLPFHPVSGSVTQAAVGVSVRLVGLNGNQVGWGEVGVSLINPGGTAVLRDVRPDDGLPFLVMATDPHFPLRGETEDSIHGRELIGLMRIPPPAQPVVSYAYGASGGGLAAEAQAWIAAMKAAVKAAEPQPVERSFGAREALIARLFERGISLALVSRGLSEAANLTLFPFRIAEVGRWVPPLQTWRGGARFNETTNPPAPFGLEEMMTFHDLLTARVSSPPTPEWQALVTLCEQIHLLSAQSHNADPTRYPLPFDALRSWIWSGVLPGGYATDVPGLPSLLEPAAAGVAQALALLPSRQRIAWILRVREDSFTGPCATLDTTDGTSGPVHLFDSSGEAFLFPDGFVLLPGTRVRVEGYSTTANGPCSGTKVEVLQASLVSLPEAVGGDANQNGVPDDWELLFLGGLIMDPAQDSDQDLVSDLEEFLGGSDPQDPGAVPAIAVPDVTPPEIEIVVTPEGGVEVEWQGKGILPPQLANLKYVVLSGGDLESIATPVAQHSASEGGRVVLRLPEAAAGTATFYRLSLCWGDCSGRD